MIKFTVFTPKAYFPDGTQDDEFKGTDVWDKTVVLAKGRRAAAYEAWRLYGEGWFRRMKPVHELFEGNLSLAVPLYVASPMQTLSLALKLSPIRVWIDSWK